MWKGDHMSKNIGKSPKFIRNVVPDRLDLRDRPYQPAIAITPGPIFEPRYKNLPVLNQGDCNGCTGFALASVLHHLQLVAGRKLAEVKVSPYMLYSMARRYDEFPGNPDVDTGSSLRGAMKGWYKHGACAAALWTGIKMPVEPASHVSEDWWLDAVRRPLGAYYRVDTRSVADMHVALNETGILYASAICHGGWDKGHNVKTAKGKYWSIPVQKALPGDGGHAFVIVGYNSTGFIIQNSWDTTWGSGGRAVLTYEDWLDNAMDCWVAQIGVVTDLHLEIAQSPTLRLRGGKVQLAAEPNLRMREISPFIVDMENNGRLSNTGAFRTQDADLDALVNQHLSTARASWGLKDKDAIDIAIYAHGGLTSEGDAAETAAKWIPALYDNNIFPIFMMWETGLWSTLQNRVEDVIKGQPRPTGGLFDGVRGWWNERLERMLAAPGSMIWGEMKQNADAITGMAESGGVKLYHACQRSPHFKNPGKMRLHLIGHSAGTILHSHLIHRLGAQGWTFDSVNFMAPAVRVDTFTENVVPAIKAGRVKRYHQFHLSDATEQKDSSCKPILGYSRSLLYLVSQSFEQGKVTPILGMEKYFDAKLRNLPNVQTWAAPCKQSQSVEHGGFDDDKATMESVIALIRGKAI